MASQAQYPRSTIRGQSTRLFSAAVAILHDLMLHRPQCFAELTFYDEVGMCHHFEFGERAVVRPVYCDVKYTNDTENEKKRNGYLVLRRNAAMQPSHNSLSGLLDGGFMGLTTPGYESQQIEQWRLSMGHCYEDYHKLISFIEKAPGPGAVLALQRCDAVVRTPPPDDLSERVQLLRRQPRFSLFMAPARAREIVARKEQYDRRRDFPDGDRPAKRRATALQIEPPVVTMTQRAPVVDAGAPPTEPRTNDYFPPPLPTFIVETPVNHSLLEMTPISMCNHVIEQKFQQLLQEQNLAQQANVTPVASADDFA